jgi:hypothetical protein
MKDEATLDIVNDPSLKLSQEQVNTASTII